MQVVEVMTAAFCMIVSHNGRGWCLLKWRLETIMIMYWPTYIHQHHQRVEKCKS